MSEEKQRIMLLERVSRLFVRLNVTTKYIKNMYVFEVVLQSVSCSDAI